jgi:hypothetical protein
MSLKLEVNFPTTRPLTDDEQVEVIWLLYTAIAARMAKGELEHLGLKHTPTVQRPDPIEY